MMSSQGTPTTNLEWIDRVAYPDGGDPAERTAAFALSDLLGLPDPIAGDDGPAVRVGLPGGTWNLGPDVPVGKPWLFARIDGEGTGEISASHPAFLYGFVHFLLDDQGETAREGLADGVLIEPSFLQNRPLFDATLTQVARTTRGFDAEAHIEFYARCGFTNIEVNGLATHTPEEPGVAGEYYPQFYTYCPGLNHFVSSSLSEGYYEAEYLSANLNRLKKLAAIGKRYGLRPGLLCFEPRSMPEAFFRRYPMLRGARVDHPFRSRLPRYVLAQDHPVARQHYREMIQNLMRAVPELEYMSVWTNDSGAGFEHTASLYVGRNGGPYMIREWRSHEAIAKTAGESAVRWLRLIRDSAAEINPDFEVTLRIEPFKVEHDTIIGGMGNGVTVEAPSLLVRGYDLPYSHVNYPDQTSVAGTIFHVEMDLKERDKLDEWRKAGFEPKLNYSASSSFNMEPLLGVPFPRLLFRKLKSLKGTGVTSVAAFGGLLDNQKTPYWPNPEVIRAVQFSPEANVDEVLMRAATRWVGPEQARDLVRLWDEIEEGVSFIPLVPLYGAFGFPWYRAWIRPLVPNLEAVPKEDRAYFERFMVTTANNPNINDLSKDVLFELFDQKNAQWMADQFDANALPRLRGAVDNCTSIAGSSAGPAKRVFEDLRDRAIATLCWTTTQRNTVAWAAGVHGYLEADNDVAKKKYRDYLQSMIDLDLENTHRLHDLWENSTTEFILVSGTGETSFVYGENLGELLLRKIELTERYRHVEPFIDADIIWRLE